MPEKIPFALNVEDLPPVLLAVLELFGCVVWKPGFYLVRPPIGLRVTVLLRLRPPTHRHEGKEHLEKQAADVALLVTEGKFPVEGNAGILQIAVAVEGSLGLLDFGLLNCSPSQVDLHVLVLRGFTLRP